MKSLFLGPLALAVTVALAGCGSTPQPRAEDARPTAADIAKADADLGVSHVDANARDHSAGGKMTNGGMDVIQLKTSAEMNLKALLKDADSAKLKGVFLSRIEGGNLMLCGKVKSKNSFGGYTGFKRFIASPNPDAPTLIEGEASGMGAAVDGAFSQAYSAVCSNPVERF